MYHPREQQMYRVSSIIDSSYTYPPFHQTCEPFALPTQWGRCKMQVFDFVRTGTGLPPLPQKRDPH